MMKVFRKNSSQLKAINYFHKKAPLHMFTWVLNTSLTEVFASVYLCCLTRSLNGVFCRAPHLDKDTHILTQNMIKRLQSLKCHLYFYIQCEIS